MDDDFCVSALQSAIRRHGTPDIFNTDQGVQFTGKAFTNELKENVIKISMDGKGRWMDNVFIERLWRSVKYEEIYIKEYDSVAELVQSLKQYFNFYNFERPHQALDGKTPAELYFGTAAALKAACVLGQGQYLTGQSRAIVKSGVWPHDQAAILASSVLSFISIPSLNFTPLITLARWPKPRMRCQRFSAPIPSL